MKEQLKKADLLGLVLIAATVIAYSGPRHLERVPKRSVW